MKETDDDRLQPSGRVARATTVIVSSRNAIILHAHAMQRDTPQRQAIRRVFKKVERPLTPDEILEFGQQAVPSLGLATVYRNVKILAGEGWLAEVEFPGGGLRYELAERPHHHHFLCRSCDQAFDIHRCPDEVEKLVPEGFEVDGHELILYGRCAGCR